MKQILVVEAKSNIDAAVYSCDCPQRLDLVRVGIEIVVVSLRNDQTTDHCRRLAPNSRFRRRWCSWWCRCNCPSPHCRNPNSTHPQSAYHLPVHKYPGPCCPLARPRCCCSDSLHGHSYRARRHYDRRPSPSSSSRSTRSQVCSQNHHC